MDLGSLLGGGGGGAPKSSAASASGVNVSYGADLTSALPWLIGGAVGIVFLLSLVWLIKGK